MKIDLHVHAKERSGCAGSSEIEQVRTAIEAGLDAIAFTDHGQLVPAARLDHLNEVGAPLQVLGGIEVTADGEDLLVLGVREPLIETRKWSYPELHSYVKEHGGFLAMAHPFRYHSEVELPLEQFPPDALEGYSNNTPPDAAARIIALAQRLDVPVLSNSDAHVTHTLGRHYNVLDRRPDDEGELFRMLRHGSFTAVVNGTGDAATTFSRRGASRG